MVPSKSDGLLLLLGSTALAFHFRTSWEDLVRELLQAGRFRFLWDAQSKTPFIPKVDRF